MRFLLSLTFPLLIGATPVGAALSTDAESALSFYRNKGSLFPSGQTSRNTLENKLVRTENEIFFRSQWDKKEFRLRADQIIRDTQVTRFAETKAAVPLLANPQRSALLLKSLPPRSAVEILAVDEFWAQVQEEGGKIQGWIPLHHLQSRHDDTGYFLNIIDVYLRTEPRENSKIITTIPRLKRILPLEIQKNFIKVQFGDHTGYADITSFVSHSDFATLAYHPKKGWQQVLYRNNDSLIFQNGSVVPLKETLGFVADSRRGVVVRTGTTYGPPIRARVNIQKLEANLWGLSRIDGHGEVWWKKTNLLEETPPASSQLTLTTDELMKRELYSVAFENKNSLRGLVSSEGIYRTEDGMTWTLIPQFGKQNYPVSIHPNGTWFVGSFKSSNRGKSFDPFIRWEQIAQAIESTYHKNPKIMRLTQIEALENSRIQIHVDTGSRRIKLRSLIGDIRWDVIRSTEP